MNWIDIIKAAFAEKEYKKMLHASEWLEAERDRLEQYKANLIESLLQKVTKSSSLRRSWRSLKRVTRPFFSIRNLKTYETAESPCNFVDAEDLEKLLKGDK